MKKILIIEDNQIVGNIYHNKLAVDGYKAEIALDGETGLAKLQTFQPDLVILDLMLPGISGVEVIRRVRDSAVFAKLPVIVFSNTYLTNQIQEAWKAGATKCLSKASCSPSEILDVVRSTIGESGAMLRPPKPAIAVPAGPQDIAIQGELQKNFAESLPATLVALRAGLQNLVRAGSEVEKLNQIYELYRHLHSLTGNAGITGQNLIACMSDAVEALLKELYEKPKSITPSSLRTVAAGVDFLGFLFERGIATDKRHAPTANVLVVDDEPISRRAVIYAVEKARMKSTPAESAAEALQLLAEKDFDLIFLDVDMPGMNGHELCSKLRTMPEYKKTPVVFVTALADFDNRTSSMMAGGNDFIAKPFLFIELTVKSLVHVLRAKLQPRE
jgi:CheY-like chemotaxis protein